MKTRHAWSAGITSGAAVGGSLCWITSTLTGPAANLGGYATAQILASTVGWGGPALSTAIAAAGGPLVVGAALSIGVGLLVGSAVHRISK